MRTRRADGVGAAGLHVARVAARALHTLVRVGTVAVGLAARQRGHCKGRNGKNDKENLKVRIRKGLTLTYIRFTIIE